MQERISEAERRAASSHGAGSNVEDALTEAQASLRARVAEISTLHSVLNAKEAELRAKTEALAQEKDRCAELLDTVAIAKDDCSKAR